MDFIKTLPLVAAALLPASLSAADYLDRSAWSWMTSSECAVGTDADIAGLAGIADGNTYTCWHSNYLASSDSPERKNPHWVMIDRGSDATPAYGLAYLPRQNGSAGTACTRYAIYFADKSMEYTPATSEQDILYALGEPAYTGTWDGDQSEKFVNFSSPVTSRYILFVNLQSNGSNSAACSEMNLLASKEQGGGGSATPTSQFNAIRIVTPGGDTHRIAIDGSQLAFSMNGSLIRMGNSGITVEYAMPEVKHFQPEHYDFSDEEFYVGPKKDIYEFPMTLSLDRVFLTLEEGKTEYLVATLENGPEGAEVVWESSNPEVAMVDESGLVSAIKAGETEVTATYGEHSASCAVTVTEAAVGINEAPVATLTFRRDGDSLYLGGVNPGSRIDLYSLGGVKVASTYASAQGAACIAVGALHSGAYLLSANGLTLKISF